jgi:hypothetical protein
MEGYLARDSKTTRGALTRRFRDLAARGGAAALAAAYDECVAARYSHLGLRGAQLPPSLATAFARHFARCNMVGIEICAAGQAGGQAGGTALLLGRFDTDLAQHGVACLQACAAALLSKFAGRLVPRPPGAMVVDAEEDAAAAAVEALVAAEPLSVTAAAIQLVVPLVAGRVTELLPVEAAVAPPTPVATPAAAAAPAAASAAPPPAAAAARLAAECRAAVQHLCAADCPVADIAARQQAVRNVVDRLIAADDVAGPDRLAVLGDCLRMRLAALVYAGQRLPDQLAAAIADREVRQMKACPVGADLLGDLVASSGDLPSVVLMYLSRFVARAYAAARAAKTAELRAARGGAPLPPPAAASDDEGDGCHEADDEDSVAAADVLAREGGILVRWQTTSTDPPEADVLAVIQLAAEAAALTAAGGDARMRDSCSALGKRDAAAPAPGDDAGRARSKPRGSGGGDFDSGSGTADASGGSGDGDVGGARPAGPHP